MYVSNCSMLPFGWTAETLLGAHTSKPYNPDIARVFYRASYIESWGRGIQKICDACKSLGTKEPEYIVHGEDIMVKFIALQSAKVPDFVNPKPQNDALENRLLKLLKENPYLTQKEMFERLSVSRATVQRLIKKLVNEKKLRRMGGKRYGYWQIPK
ncbi:MAG: winged helix-turn-helix transcriptional regulator [Roseburia sp.]|nr:winged helix-turn-helix transcriptional regulator [Roseburia sp.]